MLPAKHLRARITWRQDYAPDLWSIRITPEQPLSFKPGQYATLGVQNGSRVIERPYSIVSAPHEPEVEFFFELVPNGDLTPLLHGVGTGDEVLVRPSCKGHFQLDRRSGNRKHLMVATVTGVAPYVSMLRTLAAQPEPDVEVLLVQAASRSWELGYAAELEKLTAANSRLRYVPAISRHWEDAEWRGERGRAEDLIRKYADEAGFTAGSTNAYLCGHPSMIENARGILQRAGFAKEHVKEEVYFVLKQSAAT